MFECCPSLIAAVVQHDYASCVDRVENCFQTTALHLACGVGNLDVVLTLLDLNADINHLDVDDQTPAHYACVGGHIDVLRELFRHGANMTLFDTDGRAPLHHACERGHHEMVRVMITELKMSADLKHPNGPSPSYCAAEKGRTSIVRLLLTLGCRPNVECANFGTPLFVAAYEGYLGMVVDILEYVEQCEIGRMTPRGNLTPLTAAASRGHAEVVRALMKSGAKADILYDVCEYAPIFIAAQNNDPDVVRALINCGGKPNFAGGDGVTAMHVAAEMGFVSVVRVLIELGAPKDCVDASGATALHRAVAHNQFETARVLVLSGANLKNRSLTGISVLEACRCARVAEFIIEHLNYGEEVSRKHLTSALDLFQTSAKFGWLVPLIETCLTIPKDSLSCKIRLDL